jgi:hypothetical protein
MGKFPGGMIPNTSSTEYKKMPEHALDYTREGYVLYASGAIWRCLSVSRPCQLASRSLVMVGHLSRHMKELGAIISRAANQNSESAQRINTANQNHNTSTNTSTVADEKGSGSPTNRCRLDWTSHDGGDRPVNRSTSSMEPMPLAEGKNEFMHSE